MAQIRQTRDSDDFRQVRSISEDGRLVSAGFARAWEWTLSSDIHNSCYCGCGTKIVTPIRATEYSLVERGGQVTLHPSVGNWNHRCQSHYVIRDNQILWAGAMNRAEIDRGRARDDAEKARYFGNRRGGWWWKLSAWIKGFF